jgi:hypothetical protein
VITKDEIDELLLRLTHAVREAADSFNETNTHTRANGT